MNFDADPSLWPLLAAALAAGAWWLLATRSAGGPAAVAPSASCAPRPASE